MNVFLKLSAPSGPVWVRADDVLVVERRGASVVLYIRDGHGSKITIEHALVEDAEATANNIVKACGGER